MTYYPARSTILQNFSTITQTVYEICVTKFFHFLAPGGLTPGQKFTKRGDDLVDSEIYQTAKFHRSTPTHAQDIPYKKSCGHIHTHTHKQTVNDISTTCLSACVDNNSRDCTVTTVLTVNRSSKDFYTAVCGQQLQQWKDNMPTLCNEW